MGTRSRRWVAWLAMLVVVAASAVACSDDTSNAVGTWKHSEEGTFVLTDDGKGTFTQSGDPIQLTWKAEGTSVKIAAGKKEITAVLSGDTLTFSADDFSGDDPVVFKRS